MGLTRTLLLGLVSAIAWSSGLADAAERRTFRPDGPGPFPAIVFVSGCSGFAPSVAPNAYTSAAERFRKDGYLVVFVDYLAARGLTTCSISTIPHEVAARDVMTAVGELRAQSSVRRDAITVIGWSYGGGVAMAALETLPAGQPAPFRTVLFYPDCRGRKPWPALADVLVLFGGKDTVAPPYRCVDALATAPAQDRIIQKTYGPAFHAFDAEELPAERQYPFGTIGYHKDSATAAWAEIDGFLKASRDK